MSDRFDEIATDLVDECFRSNAPWREKIAHALRVAVAEEREACALIVEDGDMNGGDADEFRLLVVGLIRARSRTK
jgi:hypothetical protein